MKRERRLGRYRNVGTIDVRNLTCDVRAAYWDEPFTAVLVKYPLLTRCNIAILGASMPGYTHLTMGDTYARANSRHTAVVPELLNNGPQGMRQSVVQPDERYFKVQHSEILVSIFAPADTIVLY